VGTSLEVWPIRSFESSVERSLTVRPWRSLRERSEIKSGRSGREAFRVRVLVDGGERVVVADNVFDRVDWIIS
jgi:hypothetical protein